MESTVVPKTRKPRRTQAEVEAERGKHAAMQVNSLPLSLYQSFVDALEKGVAEYLKALLNQPRKPQ